MANAKFISNRIKSVRDTRKITNAMYLISSTKMRKSKKSLEDTSPYFNALSKEIRRIIKKVNNVDSPYLFPEGKDDSDFEEGPFGYLILTADKGLAGSFNQNIIKEAEKQIAAHKNNKIFVAGEFGRHYFQSHGKNIENEFVFAADEPTLDEARTIISFILDYFDKGDITKLFLIYTEYKNGLESKVITKRLLPFHRNLFISDDNEDEESMKKFEFVPSASDVLNHIIPDYCMGYIYSALVDSFCAEQNARMMAMDSANQNADKLLDKLTLEYNHIRQSTITREITEISSGAKGLALSTSKGQVK